MLRSHRIAIGLLTAGMMPLFFAATGCSGVEVGSVWAPQTAAVSFGPTYQWVSLTNAVKLDPRIQELARDVIEQELAAKGYRKQAAGAPADFWVTYRFSRNVQGDVYSSDFSQYAEGTLAIYVIEPATEKWLWKGWAQARLQEENPPEVKRKRLQEALDKVFEKFPKAGPSAGGNK